MASIEEILESIQRTLFQVGQFVEDLTSGIFQAIRDIGTTIGNSLSNFVSSIVSQIESAFVAVGSTIRDIFNNIVNGISTFISEATVTIANVVDGVVSSIQGFVSSASDLFSGIFDSVVSEIQSLFGSASAFFSEIVAETKAAIGGLVDEVVLFFTDIFNTVRDGVNNLITQAASVVQSVTQAVDRFVREVVDVVGGSLQSLLDTIADLPGEISDLAQRLVESAAENIGVPLANLPADFISTVADSIRTEGLSETDLPTQETLAMVFGDSPVSRDPEQVRQRIDEAMGGAGVAGWFFRVLFIPLTLVAVMGGIASANGQILLQEHARVNPYRLLEPQDVVTAWQRGAITEEDAVDTLERWGYDQRQALIQLSNGETLPPAGELITWLLRGFISEERFAEQLTAQGWSQDSIEQLRRSAFFIPPVADLITMSVREVFSPEVAGRFGQFDDYPDEFTVFAGEQGVSEEWARRYWAAHWALPSVQMGFEMLHRGVIQETDLDLLLRASDVMPFWRDKLKQISFSPLTRVDVRRMHKLGVLSEEEVTRAYRDIGYDEVNASRLTEFTVQLNEGSDTDDDTGLADLTRSNILTFFKDGVIDGDSARDLMVLTGVSEDAAELYIISAEMQIEAEARRDAIELIVERAKSGTISFDQAQDDLNRLPLEELEKARAINTLEREESRQVKLPSKGDLDKMIKQGVIDQGVYRETMQRIGYADVWITRYLKLQGVG